MSATTQSVVRAVRLLQIMDLLRHRSYSAAELARCLHVSQRTVLRDLSVLEAEPLYLPVVEESGRVPRYRLLS